MADKKFSPLYGIGGVTILTVLLVLCLTLFAVLTLSTAQADLRLTEKNAQYVADYYAADSLGGLMQATMQELWPSGPRPSALHVEQQLLDDPGLQQLAKTGGLTYELTVWEQDAGLLLIASISVQENQHLQLTLYLDEPQALPRWQVWQWQVVPEQVEFEEEYLPLWTGE